MGDVGPEPREVDGGAVLRREGLHLAEPRQERVPHELGGPLARRLLDPRGGDL